MWIHSGIISMYIELEQQCRDLRVDDSSTISKCRYTTATQHFFFYISNQSGIKMNTSKSPFECPVLRCFFSFFPFHFSILFSFLLSSSKYIKLKQQWQDSGAGDHYEKFQLVAWHYGSSIQSRLSQSKLGKLCRGSLSVSYFATLFIYMQILFIIYISPAGSSLLENLAPLLDYIGKSRTKPQ